MKGTVLAAGSTNNYRQLWTRSWDNFLENRASGFVLCSEGKNLWLGRVNSEGDRDQKWKLDLKGVVIHKTSNMVLTWLRPGTIGLRQFGKTDQTNIFRKNKHIIKCKFGSKCRNKNKRRFDHN
jgi:hypothetical protein